MATRTTGRNEDRPNNTRNASSASSNAGGTSNPRRNNATAAQSGSESSPGAGSQTSSSDQERELRTSRERNVRGGSSRGNVGQQQQQPSGGFGGPAYYGGSNPFAMMRRMMDDMDRLISDFGFVPPGLLASSLFGPETWSPADSSRALGSGQAGSAGSQRALSGSTSGQQGVQRGGQQGLQPWSQGLWSPQVEVLERGNNIVVRADLPGLNRDDVDVEIDNDMLIVRGERQSDFEDKQEGYYRTERSYGSFYRAIPLPNGVDPDACNATFKDGVLEVTLPKPPQAKSTGKQIQIR
jgi:HSP20 family protein